MAVVSHEPGVDPVGACVGAKGSRVRLVVNELRGEKIDVVEWVDDLSRFVANALAPAKVNAVHVDTTTSTAQVIVPDYQLSLAIGKEGQNARLAAKLTGCRIDIQSESQSADQERQRREASQAASAQVVEDAAEKLPAEATDAASGPQPTDNGEPVPLDAGVRVPPADEHVPDEAEPETPNPV
jgi:N utilization substance protein A